MKKFLILGLILCTLIIFSLVNCTVAGAELGLVGKWTKSFVASGSSVPVTIEIKSDDTGSMDYSVGATKYSYTWKIKSASSATKSMKIDVTLSNVVYQIGYNYTLTCTTLALTPDKTQPYYISWPDGTSIEQIFTKQ